MTALARSLHIGPMHESDLEAVLDVQAACYPPDASYMTRRV
jgi:hypothetical protein